jgi:hypothetical protein
MRAESTATPVGRGAGSGRGGWRAAVVAGVLSVAAVVAVVLVLGGGAGGASTGSAKYGGLPAWLPKPRQAVDQIRNASVEHPWLSAVEGETVSVALASGRVLATVVGPSVPEAVSERAQDGDDNSETAPCKFTATFASASGEVPLRAGDFTILDERGRAHAVRVTAANGGPLPSRVLPGRPVALRISATLPEGEGALRWAPNGPRVLAGWVFGLELD